MVKGKQTLRGLLCLCVCSRWKKTVNLKQHHMKRFYFEDISSWSRRTWLCCLALLSWMKLLKPPSGKVFLHMHKKLNEDLSELFSDQVWSAMLWFYLYLYIDIRLNAGITMDVPLMKDGTLTDGTWCIYFSLEWSTNFLFLFFSLPVWPLVASFNNR